jgi:hypothetical protein
MYLMCTIGFSEHSCRVGGHVIAAQNRWGRNHHFPAGTAAAARSPKNAKTCPLCLLPLSACIPHEVVCCTLRTRPCNVPSPPWSASFFSWARPGGSPAVCSSSFLFALRSINLTHEFHTPVRRIPRTKTDDWQLGEPARWRRELLPTTCH